MITEMEIMELMDKVEKIIKIHKELHGKGIVDYAIVDDVLRKHKDSDKVVVEGIVKFLLKED